MTPELKERLRTLAEALIAERKRYKDWPDGQRMKEAHDAYYDAANPKTMLSLLAEHDALRDAPDGKAWGIALRFITLMRDLDHVTSDSPLDISKLATEALAEIDACVLGTIGRRHNEHL